MAKEKKGRGTGLGVLFGEDDFSEAESELMTLPISKVEPRKEFIERKAQYAVNLDY